MIIKNKYFKNILLLCSFIILSLIFIYPLAKTNAVYFSDDMFFHLQRIKEIAENAKSGNYFVGIYTHTFGKIGYPLNLFYPWVTVLPFSLFSILCSNQAMAVYLGVAFYTFLTLNFTYLTVKKYSQNGVQAYFTACLYTFSSYRIIDAFTRFALGEYIALTFLPLCIYGLYAIAKGNYRDWPYLAFGFSFVLLSHLLSVVLISILLVVLLVALIPHINDVKQRITAFLKAIIVSILSSAIFVFPFIEQELFQKYPQPDVTDLTVGALLPTKFISASLNNNLSRVDSGNTYNIGIVILLVIILGLVTWRKLKRDYKVMYLMGLMFTMLSTSLIPWSLLQNTPLSIIQFPWRFLGIATLLFSVVGGASIYQFLQIDRLGSAALAASLVGVTILILMPFISSMQQLKGTMLTTEQLVMYDKNGRFVFSGIDRAGRIGLFHFENYTPLRGQRAVEDLYNHQAYVNGKAKKVHVEPSGNQLTIKSNYFANSKDIVLPVMNYKNLEITDNNRKKVEFSTDNYDRLRVKPTGRTTTFNISYRPSLIDCLSVIISCLTWLTAIIIWTYRKIWGWGRSSK